MSERDPVTERLENQIKWYDDKSKYSQFCFKTLKIIEIVTAATIPFAAGNQWPATLIGLLGVIIIVIEGLQSLFQFHQNWMGYRSTCEYLKHEKHLFLASAGPYKDVTNSKILLAERIETLVSQEHAKWISVCEKTASKHNPT
jgi:hypothetical protein